MGARANSCFRPLLGTAVLLVAGACQAQSPTDSPPTVLRDVTATHLPQAPDLHALDIALADFDGDGDLDAALAVEGDVNRLYLNDGHGRFAWRKGAFGQRPHDTEHVRAADFDRDGHVDVVFVAEDDRTHQLFLGRGDGRFVDASDRLPATSEGNALAVGDVNGDGLSDIVIGNSGGKEGGRNFLWLNDPDRPGWFEDRTATHFPAVGNRAQGVALVDLDGDGDLDMAVATETPPTRLLVNDGTGRFAEASDRLDQVTPLETREVHAFDANGDGQPDLLLLNLTSNAGEWEKDPQARLLMQNESGRFVDETATRLPSNRFSSWGGAVMDFTGDGHSDLIVGAIEVPGFEPLQVRAYANDGQGRFHDATVATIPSTTIGRSWSMAVGDVNGDGADDLFIGGWGTQARLLLGRPVSE
ncbi:FG-GAP repeat domain-containing protein [Pelagerythrobacter aerophilus]|uniref:VCBS repeat-containing protein n=1 Tax=Pelagerythrobacter aerophilus TaxID=2306995 RepID=A0A418NF80_9SPHN|nr:VCBS repeat-containing protein [Pelagerythrobacter aerophilus]RIV77008.1 VCBS repeat-containing protein [Pelagerythrobacter aerophilus]